MWDSSVGNKTALSHPHVYPISSSSETLSVGKRPSVSTGKKFNTLVSTICPSNPLGCGTPWRQLFLDWSMFHLGQMGSNRALPPVFDTDSHAVTCKTSQLHRFKRPEPLRPKPLHTALFIERRRPKANSSWLQETFLWAD